MIRREDVYKIGRMGKPHGVKGEISFQFSDDIFDRVDADYLILEIDGILVPFFMEEYRFRSDEIALVTFVDITSDARARELTGCDVYFPREYAEEDDEQLTWAAIVGYTITDASTGQSVGIVRHVDDTTINILFEVESEDGRELLLPAGEDMVTAVDRQQRIIEMNIPEGLLNL